jgi:hypothetical protein
MSDESQAGEPREDIKQADAIKSATAKESNANTPSGSAVSPRATNVQPSQCNSSHTQKAEKYSVEWWKPRIEILGIFGGLAVGVLIYLQYSEMRQQRILDERAWVAPFEMSLERGVTDTNYVFLKLEFKNTGKSPALKVSEAHGFTVGFNNVPTNDPIIPTNSMMLAPNSTTFIRSQPIYYMDIENFIANDAPACIYGKISYEDIFGNRHWTQFCWSLEDGRNFRPSPVHNSTDDAQTNQTN